MVDILALVDIFCLVGDILALVVDILGLVVDKFGAKKGLGAIFCGAHIWLGDTHPWLGDFWLGDAHF